METNIRNFLPIEKLGEGSFASVYKVQRVCDQQIYALKKIRMGHLPPKARENSLNEVRLLASLHSPYIIKYYEAFFDHQIDCLCIVMEWAEQGDLRGTINSAKKHKKLITEMQIWKLAIHLLHGLKALHDKSILHRDLKCENILISGGLYKIGDMNVSKINKEGMVFTQTGTPYYASPEVWKDQPYDEKSDIWSIGCILYEMACLRPPFTGSSMNDLHRNIMRGIFSPIPKIYSNQLADIISQCLKQNPHERPCVDTLLSNWSLKMYESICLQYRMQTMDENLQMLKTISMPKDIKDLNKCLPKSNYKSDQHQSNQKAAALQELNTDAKESEDERQQIKIPPIYSQSIKKCEEEKGNQVIQIEISQDGNSLVKIEIESNKEILSQQNGASSEESDKVGGEKQSEIVTSQKEVSSGFEADVVLKSKRTCSLYQISDHPEEKPDQTEKQTGSTKSLQEIQSFNRLIERIKSSSKMSAKKIEKIQPKIPRRQLKDLNSNKLAEPLRNSKSKSMKRTERSMSRQISKDCLSKDCSKPSSLNYKICSYANRKQKNNTENYEKILASKYLIAPISNKYTQILQQAKGYLKRSASRKNKIF